MTVAKKRAKPAARPAKAAPKAAAKPAANAAPKAAAKPAATPKPGKPVTVGRLADWPLGARLAKLLDLPASAAQLACVQVIGRHGPAVLEALGGRPSLLDPVAARAQAALDACTKIRGATVETTQLVHPSLAPEEIAARLGEAFRVLSPAEAVTARRKTPAQSLKQIEKNLAQLQGLGVQRKSLLAWLEGKGKLESVLGADPDVLRDAMASEPEAYNEVDEQLFTLWARRCQERTLLPRPNPDDLEYGCDRRTLYLDKMAAAGMDGAAAEGRMLDDWAQLVRRWPSTGVWVWEALLADARALSQRVLASYFGPTRLVYVLEAVLDLPTSTLEAGALDVVKKVCADRSMVPDKTLDQLLANKEYRELLGVIARTG
jgi:hypothetical protein